MKIHLTGSKKIYRRNKGFWDTLHLDPWILLGVLLLIATGTLIIYTASAGNEALATKHLIRAGIAFIIMIAFAQIPPTYLKIIAPWLFILGIIMLISVLVFGDIGKGAQRWLDLGLIRFQPSELMKIALPIMLAWLFAHGLLPPSGKRMLIGIFLVGLTAGLIAIQPDLGTAILITMSGMFVLFFAGLSWKWIFSAIVVAISSTPIIWNFYMLDYQKQRVLTFLDPESDPLGAGYHIIQSKIAIGSGGIDGKGFMEGTQANLNFLPESTTDFIFSVFAEEFGLIGVILLLALYSFIIMRGLYIASQAQDNFTRLLAASLTMTMFVYVFVNIGMVSGIVPVVGLPLPLISYGGSALLTLMISFGILMSIHTHKKMLSQ